MIGRESHIGANSVVVAGVTIGERCQIGAGSVVTKDIPAYSVAVATRRASSNATTPKNRHG